MSATRPARAWWRRALVLLSLAAMGAILAVVSVLRSSLLESSADFEELVGASSPLEVVAATNRGMTDELIDDLRAGELDGQLVPMVRKLVMVDGRAILLLGVPDEAGSGWLRGAADSLDAAGPDAVLVSGPLGRTTGRALDVVGVDGQIRKAVVSGPIGDDAVAELNGGTVMLAPLALAQELAGTPGRLDVLIVQGQAAAVSAAQVERVRALVDGRAVVTTPSARADLLAGSLAPFVALLQAIGLGVVALVALAYLVAQSVAFRQVLGSRAAQGNAALRLAAGPVLAAVGAASLGGLVGVVAGRVAVLQLPDVITSATGMRFRPVVHLGPVLLSAAAAGVLSAASFAVALVSRRRSRRRAPAAGRQPNAALAGAGIVAAAGCWVALRRLDGGGALPALAVGAGASLAVWPALSLGCCALLDVLAGRCSGPARVAFRQAATVTAASTVANAIAAASVALVVIVTSLTTATSSGLTRSFRGVQAMEFVVQSSPFDDLPVNALFPRSTLADLKAVEGVGRVWPGQFLVAEVASARLLVEGVERGVNEPFLRAASQEARRAVLDGSGAVYAGTDAARRGLSVGDRLRFATDDGWVSLPIVDTVPYPTFAVDGLVAVSRDLVGEWFGFDEASWFEIDLEAGADVEEVRRAVRSVLVGPERFGVGAGAELSAVTDGQVHSGVRGVALAAWFGVALGALAAVAVLGVTWRARREELVAVPGAKAPPRRIVWLLRVQAALVFARGSLAGLLVGVTSSVVLLDRTTAVAGLPVAGGVPFGTVAAAAVGAWLVYVAVGAVALGFALRLAPSGR